MAASRAAELQMQIRENNTDLSDFLKDLNRWEGDIKNEDLNLKNSRRLEQKLPPVRVKSKKADLRQVEKQPPAKRIQSSDYDAWEKFDVENACKDVDVSEDENEEEEDFDEDQQESIENERRVQKSVLEKDKGNQLFKEGKYEAAIIRYTNAIMLNPSDPIFYANRAMAQIKVERYAAAEQDCTTALQYDPQYAKALARRATARQKLKNHTKALEDYNSLLSLEPNNKQAISEKRNIKKVQLEEKQKKKKQLKRIHIEEIGADEMSSHVTSRSCHSDYSELQTPVKDFHSNSISGKTTTSSPSTIPSCETSSSSTIPSCETSSPSAIPSCETSSPSAISSCEFEIPSNSFLFETKFKALRTDTEQLYMYIKNIPSQRYNKLFSQCIDTLLSPLIRIFAECYLRDGISYIVELRFLTKVGRFKMAAMFLSRQDKKTLEILFENITTAATSAELSDLRKEFCL